MNVVEKTKKCVGCGACVDKCAVNALSLQKDKNGFLVASIDNSRCVDCGLCLKVCPSLEKTEKNDFEEKYYCGTFNNNEVRTKSSSGGFFSAIADYVLKQNGVVYGAKYDNEYTAVLMDSTDNVDIDELRRSKYSQGNPNGMYKSIAENLKQDRLCLVVGTPCQIDAARKSFGNNQNLILVDFVCGGVTPQTVFENYTKSLKEKYKSKIISLNFRDKKYGWKVPNISVKFENGKEYHSPYQFDKYYYYFYSTHYLKNLPCLSCDFKNHYAADITLGDFWGYKSANIEVDNNGISMALIHSEQGNEIFGKISDVLSLKTLEKSQIEYCFKKKQYSEKMLKDREAFLAKVEKDGFVKTSEKEYFKYGKLGVYIKRITKRIKKFL